MNVFSFLNDYFILFYYFILIIFLGSLLRGLQDILTTYIHFSLSLQLISYLLLKMIEQLVYGKNL